MASIDDAREVGVPFIRTFPPGRIDTILDHFREITLEQGGVLIRKGEMNLNLYIVFDGELNIEDGGVHIGTVRTGELCGEMSYLGADVALSTVVAAKKTTTSQDALRPNHCGGIAFNFPTVL